MANLELSITSTPQLPFKIPHIPTTRDHKAFNRGTLGGSRNTMMPRSGLQIARSSSKIVQEWGGSLVGVHHQGKGLDEELPTRWMNWDEILG